jgi:hypothetical protein
MNSDFDTSDTANHKIKVTWYNRLITFSRFFEMLHNHRYFAVIRRLCWPIAFSVMAYEAPKFSLTHSPEEQMFYVLDVLVNIFFMLDCWCRLFGTLLKIQIEKVCKREMTTRAIISRSGILDIIVTALCFAYGFTTTGLWFRLVRLVLITASALEMFPQMDVLMVSDMQYVDCIF